MSASANQQADGASWLLGDDASRRVEVLASSLYARAFGLRDAERPGRYDNYQPWMSGDFGQAIEWPNGSDVSAPCPVIKSETSLRKVREALSSGLKIGMGVEAASVDICVDLATLYPEAALYHEAWTLILSTKSYMADLLQDVVRQVIPTTSTRSGLWSGVSSSSQLAVGAIFLALPPAESRFPRLDMAISVAHELGHQVLMIYQRSDRILASSLDAPSFSGTRGGNRPAIRAVHAATALAFMKDCCRLLRDVSSLSSEERSYLLKQQQEKAKALNATIRGLRAQKFTPFGRELLAELTLHTRV